MTRLEREVNRIAKDYYSKEIYINAINCTEKEIRFLREALKDDRLRVSPKIVDYINPKFIDKYLSGEFIFPQMDYIVISRNFPFNQTEESFVLRG